MEAEVSHAEIYRELGILQGKMDSLILSRAKDDQDRTEIFRRIGTLESRMAQVIILAALAGLVLPAVLGWFADFVTIGRQPQAPAQIEQQR
jgi:hypothetical protein